MRALLAVCLVIAGAHAAAAESCSTMVAKPWARQSTKAKERLLAGEEWAHRKVASWKTIRITVSIDRAPHLVREILEDCPGVTLEQAAVSRHPRRLASTVLIHVTSFAALLRVIQLPAVTQLALSAPSQRRLDRLTHPLIPEPAIFFDE